MAVFNPHLAADAVLGQISYPKVALPKLNGVRGGVQESVLLSRQLKPIPNDYIRTLLSIPELDLFEGELVVGDYGDESVFTNSTSGVMSEAGFPDFCWYMFDVFHPTMPFIDRIKLVSKKADEFDDPRIVAVPWFIVNSDEELVALGDKVLDQRYEGLVLRDPNAKYKEGRSTEAEGSFLRYVPWLRSEAVILDIFEGKINLNESKRNELGYLEKSSHKDNKVGSGRAGTFLMEDLRTGIQFKTPVPGAALQEEAMAHRERFLAKIAKYKFKKAVKKGGAPRFPQYEGLRHPLDM